MVYDLGKILSNLKEKQYDSSYWFPPVKSSASADMGFGFKQGTIALEYPGLHREMSS